MLEIDNYLKNEAIEISKKLVSANVQHVFNIDSSRLDSLLLTESSKHSNIPVFSFLHGYLSSNIKDFPKKRLLDNLLVWDYRLKKILMPFYDEPDKIINFGYPKYDLKKINQMKIKPKYDFLFALSYTPISEIIFLLEFINEINLKEKKVLIRFHHFNYDLDRNKISQIMKKNNHIDYHYSSRNDLLIDLLSSEKVLGFNTSVLFEAYVLGKNVYQIQSNKISFFMDYEFIPILNIDSLAMEQIRIILFENKKNKFSKLNNDFKEDIINLLKY